MKKIISELLQKALKKENVKISNEEIEKFIEIPPSIEMGDYAFPCFFLASKFNYRHKSAKEYPICLFCFRCAVQHFCHWNSDINGHKEGKLRDGPKPGSVC